MIKAWMIHDGDEFVVWTGRAQKHTCLGAFVIDMDKTWNQLRKQGYTCRQVVIAELAKEPRAPQEEKS